MGASFEEVVTGAESLRPVLLLKAVVNSVTFRLTIIIIINVTIINFPLTKSHHYQSWQFHTLVGFWHARIGWYIFCNQTVKFFSNTFTLQISQHSFVGKYNTKGKLSKSLIRSWIGSWIRFWKIPTDVHVFHFFLKRKMSKYLNLSDITSPYYIEMFLAPQIDFCMPKITWNGGIGKNNLFHISPLLKRRASLIHQIFTEGRLQSNKRE